MSGVSFVYLRYVIGHGSHSFLFGFAHLCHILGSEDVRVCSSRMTWSPKYLHPLTAHPRTSLICPRLGVFLAPSHPDESLGLSCALCTRVCTTGDGCGLSLLCAQAEVRSLREKRGRRYTRPWEKNDREEKLTSFLAFLPHLSDQVHVDSVCI